MKETFLKNYPKAYFLESEISGIEKYLQQQNILQENEKVANVEVAGEGNMNCTLRAVTNTRSIIIKQARPWVEKYSHIKAPIERAVMEGKFYEIVQGSQVAQMMPTLLHLDENSYILILEDLGKAQDFLCLYESEKNISSEELQQLTSYLVNLHCNFTKKKCFSPLVNKNMRLLNHEHMYNLPFIANDLNLDEITPGLMAVADEYRQNKKFTAKVQELGKFYLEDGDTLLHGDYYPGSWLTTSKGIKIIDPEFCFFGMAEFDMGVFIAHLILAQQPRSYILKFLAQYKKKRSFDRDFVFQLAGVEIMRRLFGVAQLPLTYKLQEKQELLSIAYKFVMQTV